MNRGGGAASGSLRSFNLKMHQNADKRLFHILMFSGNDYIRAGYYISLSMSFLYICANPFIYATKFDPVKRVLLGLIPCKKESVQPIQTVESATAQSAKRTNQNPQSRV